MIITGKVFDENDKGKDVINTIGLPFAIIYEKGKMSNNKTADARGQFSINIDKGKQFIIRNVGYIPLEVTAETTSPTAYYLKNDPQTNLNPVTVTTTRPVNKGIYLLLGLLALLLLATKKK